MDIRQWESVLPESLHAIRSLLCTSTNQTPHERLFKYQRRAATGISLPTWLMAPGPIFLRRYPKGSKYETAVEKVELLDANPQYAFIRFPDGRVSSLCTRSCSIQNKGRD